MSAVAKIDRASLNKLVKQMRSVPEEVSRPVINSFNRSGAKIVETARGLVPVRTGALRSAIAYTVTIVEGSADRGLVIRLTYGIDTSKLKIPSVARWVEFGTKKTGAKPYFFPGYWFNKKSLKSSLRSAIKRGSKKAAAK